MLRSSYSGLVGTRVPWRILKKDHDIVYVLESFLPTSEGLEKPVKSLFIQSDERCKTNVRQ